MCYGKIKVKMLWVNFLALLLLLPEQHHALLLVRPPSTLHRPIRKLDSSSLSRRVCTTGVNAFYQKLGVAYSAHGPHQNNEHATVLYSSTESEEGTEETAPLSVVLAVGIVASFVGYLYSKAMKAGFHLLWDIIPKAIFGGGGGSCNKLCDLLHQYPAAYIVLTMTFGGGLVATLSTFKFPNLFSAHDYVHILSRGEDSPCEVEQFPQARTLWPVLLMSILTSISGFSLGPEAPMVTAGGLLGVSLARKYLQSTSSNNTGSKEKKKSSTSSIEETFAFVGAAGTLTGFMNIPLAGPIFAMEMVGRDAGISPIAAKNWSAALAASFAGMVFIRGGLVPNANLGGHFTYGARAAVGTLTGREMVLASLGCGVGGAIVGTCFHKFVRFLKSMMWPEKSASNSDESKKYPVIGKKMMVALAIGLISVLYPQTMFWGEGSLQCAVDGQCTPFSATPHGIPSIMTKLARVNPNEPFGSVYAALQVGLAKFMAIALASAGGFPGGVIFPLLSNGASLGHALVSALRPILPSASSSLVSPLMVMSLMSATLTSITRTPLATVLILSLTASGMTPLSVLLPGVLMASYISVWASERLSSESFFSYSK